MPITLDGKVVESHTTLGTDRIYGGRGQDIVPRIHETPHIVKIELDGKTGIVYVVSNQGVWDISGQTINNSHLLKKLGIHYVPD